MLLKAYDILTTRNQCFHQKQSRAPLGGGGVPEIRIHSSTSNSSNSENDLQYEVFERFVGFCECSQRDAARAARERSRANQIHVRSLSPRRAEMLE